MKQQLIIMLVSVLMLTQIVVSQQQWVKNTFPGQGHIDNPGPWKAGQGYDRTEWVSAFGVSPVIPSGDTSPLMLQVTDLATLQYSSDGKEFKRANIPLTRGGAVGFNPHDGNVGYALMEADFVIGKGGWWKTEDKGETWEFMFRAPSVRGQRNNLIEVNPNSQFKNHIYVATSLNDQTANPGSNDTDNFENYSLGLYRSTDNGTSWGLIDFSGESIYQIRFSADGSVLYVLTYPGGNLNDSGNGNLYTLTFNSNGTNYTKNQIASNVRNFDLDPTANDKGMLLDGQGHLYSFTNFGANRSLVYNARAYRFVEINPSNKDHIILFTASQIENNPFVWSNDGGTTWNLIETENGVVSNWYDYAPINFFSTNYNFTIENDTNSIVDGNKDAFAFYPNSTNKVLTWATNIRKGPLLSEDYGKTFTPFAHGGSLKGTEWAAVGEDIGVMGFAKNESGFTLTKDNGLTWKTASVMSSPTLNDIAINHPNDRKFRTRNPNSLDFNPDNNDIIVATFAISPTYIVRSEDFGETWIDLFTSFNPVRTTSGAETLRATKVFWHNQNPNIVYAGNMRSTDGGRNFFPITGGHFVTDMHKGNGDVVISYESGSTIFISYDAGNSWGEITNIPFNNSQNRSSVEAYTGGIAFDLRPIFDPGQNRRLRFLIGGINGVWQFIASSSGSYTGTWTFLRNGFDLSIDPYHTSGDPLLISQIVVDETSNNFLTMYAITGGSSGRRTYYKQIYKSTDAGSNWTNIAVNSSGDVPNYVSSRGAFVDGEGNFMYSDWDGLYMYRDNATVMINSEDTSKGTATGSGTFDYQTPVNAVAEPKNNLRFNGWQEDGKVVNGDEKWTFHTYLDRTLTATFTNWNAPSALTADNITGSSFDLSWEPSQDNPNGYGITGYRIFNNGTEIATTANTSYSFTGLTEETTYNITIEAYNSYGDKSPLSSALQVTTKLLSISDNEIEENIVSLYPNPVKSTLKIHCNEKLHLSIYSIIGKLVLQEKISSSLINIDVNNFAKGMYLFKFKRTNGQSFIKKVIIN